MADEAKRGIDSQIVTLHTPLGPVDVLYDLRVEGDTLHLSSLTVYPRSPTPLSGVLRELLTARSQVVQYARELGFARLRITAHRAAQSSSANPGKVIDVIIDI
jgi:hypothetical protein